MSASTRCSSLATSGLGDLGGIGWRRGFALAAFGGLPLALLSYLGYLFVPLGHGGIIQPSCAALGGMILARVVLKEPLPARRVVGALVIVVGLAVIGAEAFRTIGAHGVGGDLLSLILPRLPMNSTIYVYGFLGGSTPVSFSTMLLMGKNLVLRRYSVLENTTVSNPLQLAAAMKEIEGLIDEPLFRTRIGKEFSLDQIDQAMAYEETPGARAVFVM